MSEREILLRAACVLGKIDSLILRHQKITADDRKRLNAALHQLAEVPLFIDDSLGSTIPAIHAALRKRSSNHRPRLVVIDYLQLMNVVGRPSNRTEAVSAISRGLKQIARNFNVSVLAMSQLNREPEKERRPPVLSDLRESGSIEQDSDNVLFLHEEGERDAVRPDPNKYRLIVAKQRNGPVGNIPLEFYRRFTRFEEC